MLGGDTLLEQARKPDIMADAAYAIITKPAHKYTGNFCIDETVLRQEGVKDFDRCGKF
jgi:citronellol/citronellal dehydrogenase